MLDIRREYSISHASQPTIVEDMPLSVTGVTYSLPTESDKSGSEAITSRTLLVLINWSHYQETVSLSGTVRRNRIFEIGSIGLTEGKGGDLQVILPGLSAIACISDNE